MFSRSSVGGIRQGIREGKRMAILTKVLFSILGFLGSSLVRPWFVLGLLHGVDIQGTREQNLNKSAFELARGKIVLYKFLLPIFCNSFCLDENIL